MKWWIAACFLVLVALPGISAQDGISVTIEEEGTITNYLDTYWIVNVQGNGSITNPSENDLYDLRLFFDALGLSVVEGPGDGELTSNSLYFDRIEAEGSANFTYQLVGITAQPPTLNNRGVLYTALSKLEPKIYTTVFGRLQKSEVEDDRDARLISVTFENPSSIEYTIESMRVVKTPQLDPNEQLNEWVIVEEGNPRVLEEDGFFVRDFVDEDAREGEVYWLQSDLYISSINIFDSNNITRLTEQNLSVPLEEITDDMFNVSDNVTENVSVPSPSADFMLRKTVSDTLVLPGEPVTVNLRLYNFRSSLERYIITDSLPAGFVSDQELSWEGDISARSAIDISYRATLEQGGPAGLDRFPAAQGTIRDSSVRSQPVAFVRQFSPEQRLYVQKGVERVDDMYSRVTISVRNLGSDAVEGVTIREALDDEAEFSQISQQPESKGVWRIERLGAGDDWEVSYVTQSGNWVELLPAVFGVSSEGVMRTLLLENVVREAWSFVRTNTVELVGMSLLVLLPALLVIGRRLEWLG